MSANTFLPRTYLIILKSKFVCVEHRYRVFYLNEIDFWFVNCIEWFQFFTVETQQNIFPKWWKNWWAFFLCAFKNCTIFPFANWFSMLCVQFDLNRFEQCSLIQHFTSICFKDKMKFMQHIPYARRHDYVYTVHMYVFDMDDR